MRGCALRWVFVAAVVCVWVVAAPAAGGAVGCMALLVPRLAPWRHGRRGDRRVAAGAAARLGERQGGVRHVLDRLAETLDEAVAEVADRVGRPRELVADQRQLEAADGPVEQVLQSFEEHVDAVDAQQQLVEQAQGARVKSEQVGEGDGGAAVRHDGARRAAHGAEQRKPLKKRQLRRKRQRKNK